MVVLNLSLSECYITNENKSRMSFIPRFQALFKPEQYHGWGKTKKYFEGWYYKLVTADESNAFAFIPGIAMDQNGNKQAFIQVLDGKNLKAEYFKFDAADFQPTKGKFDVTIVNNHFTRTGFKVNLPGITGELSFKNQVPWSTSLYSPNIMGPFTFVPFMQCYHGILSMNHTIQGKLDVNGKEIDFTGGRGYMEKDWGKSFPSGYIWMQTNHFSKPGISMKSSVAKIPWLGSSFIGFIAGILVHDRLIEFTTYNLTKLRKSYADESMVHIVMENRKHRLEIRAEREAATALASPIQGFMDGRIEESMTAVIHTQLYDKKSKTYILDDMGRNAGLEVAGRIEDVLV